MGNGESIGDSLKAQANSGSLEIYKLVNMGGTGILVEMMKEALVTKNYKEIDDYIRNDVKKFLYNEGAGEQVPIEKIVLRRIGKDHSGVNVKPRNEAERTRPTKELCFIMEKTGAVGETLIHMCLLNATYVHSQLCKRLLKIFPKMVNDIYLSDLYFGEAPLHIAIVSEDPNMVKFLLVMGADVHQRASGMFFGPDDQKTGRQDPLDQECAVWPIETSYAGFSYFGEYPLSFAAILNQEECIRLLLAKDADPNKQDSNGNTVLHMLVINDNLSMFKFMMANGALLTLKNRQGMTPLTLAAKLGRVTMFEFILVEMRELLYVYADIQCAAVYLNTIDTISQDGSLDTNSALYLVVNGESENHLKLLDGVLVRLLDEKWRIFLKKQYITEVVSFFVYFTLCGITIVMKKYYYDYLRTDVDCVIQEVKYTAENRDCDCAYLYPPDPDRNIRLVLEIICLLYTIGYVIMSFYELYILKWRLYFNTLKLNPSKVLWLMSFVTLLLIIPCRFSCNIAGEDYLIVFTIILQSTYILYLGRGLRITTIFIFLIHGVLKVSFFRWLIIMFIFVVGFSQSFYMIHNYGRLPGRDLGLSPLQSIMDTIALSVRDMQGFYDNLLKLVYPWCGRFWLVVFAIVCSLMLVDMLISMISNTYETASQLEREWVRQWAKQVLTMEQNLGVKFRQKQQIKYSTECKGQRAMLVLWKQTADERAQTLACRAAFAAHMNALEDAPGASSVDSDC